MAADGGCIAPCGRVGLDEPPAQRDGTKHQLLDGSWSDEKRWRYPDLVARRPCAMLGVNMFVIFVIVGIVGAAGCASSAIRQLCKKPCAFLAPEWLTGGALCAQGRS